MIHHLVYIDQLECDKHRCPRIVTASGIEGSITSSKHQKFDIYLEKSQTGNLENIDSRNPHIRSYPAQTKGNKKKSYLTTVYLLKLLVPEKHPHPHPFVNLIISSDSPERKHKEAR